MKKLAIMSEQAKRKNMFFLFRANEIQWAKPVITLCLLMVAQGAFAYIKEGQTANVRFMQGSGYSQSTLRIIDEQQARQASVYEQYAPYYQSKYYPEKKTIGYWYDRLKVWFDPAQDDGLFGAHEINFDNKFFQNQPQTTVIEDL